MARGLQGALLRVLGARDHVATVTSILDVAPGFRRVRFAAPTLFAKVRAEPAAWLRFWFPDPAGGSREFQRAYTIALADTAAGEFDADFVMHTPAGPASAWAAKAVPGDQLSVMSLGSSSYQPAPDASGLLLIGDPSSIPAINAILAATPPKREVELVLERGHDDDELIPVSSHPRLSRRWVQRDGPDSLVESIEGRDWSGWQVWAAGESGSLKAVRSLLRRHPGVAKADTHVQAYWIEGRAMGTATDDRAAPPLGHDDGG